MPSINWTAFFDSRHDNTAGNKNTTVYTEAWAQDKDYAVKVSFLTNDANTAILAANANDTILFLHSFKNIGGTPIQPANKFVCFLGSNENASVVIIDTQSTTANANLRTPTHTAILDCADAAAIAALPVPPNNAPITYPGCATFLPAPWLVTAVLAAGTNKPFDLIIAAKTAAQAFDDINGDDPLFLTSARDHLEDFVLWAWGVAKNKVPKVSYAFDPDDEDVTRYKTSRIHQCILPLPPAPHPFQGMPMQGGGGPPPNFLPPPPAAGNPPLPINNNPNDVILLHLANSITRQSEEAATHNDLMNRQLHYTMERDDKKKDRIKKLHPSVKHLLLFASAEDADNVPDDILDSCKRFINAESEGNADLELNMQFKNLNLHDAAFLIGFIQALYNGRFLWADRSTPSNFSPFCIFEVEPLLAAEQQNRHFTLHIVLTQGKGRTIEEIKAGSKQEVKAPTSYLEMIQQLNYFSGACNIFFGEFSVATSSIQALINVVEKYKHIFKAREARETEFVSKFLFAVDTRMQLWLEECATLTSRDQVDDSTLNFSALVDSVRFGTFDVKLPPTFFKPEPEAPEKRPSKQQNEGDATDVNKPSKKPKNRLLIVNSSPPTGCSLNAGETWATHFANKTEHRVKWDDEGCFMCPRWFICGRCFTNCKYIKSHVIATEIPKEKLTAFKEYMKRVRSSN